VAELCSHARTKTQGDGRDFISPQSSPKVMLYCNLELTLDGIFALFHTFTPTNLRSTSPGPSFAFALLIFFYCKSSSMLELGKQIFKFFYKVCQKYLYCFVWTCCSV